MNDYERRQESLKKKNRCIKCKYRKTIHAQYEWMFDGCCYKPYRGKWIQEINECPKDEIYEKESAGWKSQMISRFMHKE